MYIRLLSLAISSSSAGSSTGSTTMAPEDEGSGGVAVVATANVLADTGARNAVARRPSRKLSFKDAFRIGREPVQRFQPIKIAVF